MKKIATLTAAAALLAIAVTPEALSQPGPQRRGAGWGYGSSYVRNYDPKTVQTVSGQVVTVGKFKPEKGAGPGIHLMLKTEKESIPVHLGPAWYVENQESTIEAGDKIEVKGSRITFQEKPAIIAAEVKKGDEVLKLRDEAGTPMWAGWRRR